MSVLWMKPVDKILKANLPVYCRAMFIKIKECLVRSFFLGFSSNGNILFPWCCTSYQPDYWQSVHVFVRRVIYFGPNVQ